ncbi:hypothetical protein AB1L88_15495 [Tautonia sp. JC769]|uniref:hypothetical protein n=1 Tax=Tautonia sp. JC769 TaxID=3232135 RepID=UPI003458A65A
MPTNRRPTTLQVDPLRQMRIEQLAEKGECTRRAAIRDALRRFAAEAPEAIDALGRVPGPVEREARPGPGRGHRADGPELTLTTISWSPHEDDLIDRLAVGLDCTTRDVVWKAIDHASGHPAR